MTSVLRQDNGSVPQLVDVGHLTTSPLASSSLSTVDANDTSGNEPPSFYATVPVMQPSQMTSEAGPVTQRMCSTERRKAKTSKTRCTEDNTRDDVQKTSAASSTPSIDTLSVRRDWYSTLATFAAGGIAGAASRTVTAPLDRVKIILQEGYLVVNGTPQPARSFLARRNGRLADAARLIRNDGGWTAFWRGNLINCFKAGPEFAIVFSLRRYLFSHYNDLLSQEQARRASAESVAASVDDDTLPADTAARGKATERDAPRVRSPDTLSHITRSEQDVHHKYVGYVQRVPMLVVNCAIGAAAGLAAQSLLYPMEVVKTRVIVSRKGEGSTTVRAVVRDAYRRGGYREFFRGFTPNMLGIVVYRGLEMGLYSSAQQSLMLYRMQWEHKSRHEAVLSAAEVGGVGMLASIVAQTVSYPLNVVRTRLQTQGVNGRDLMYTGMLDCLRKTVRQKGFLSLFSGITANYLKAVPASACTFVVFEKVQQLLLNDN